MVHDAQSTHPPIWYKLARQCEGISVESNPRGLILSTVNIIKQCSRGESIYRRETHLQTDGRREDVTNRNREW